MGDLDIWMDEGFIRQAWYTLTGETVNVKLIRDKYTHQSAGYCFVDFSTHESAQNCLNNMNGTLIPGTNRTLKLNWATGGISGIFSGLPQTGPEYSVFVGDLSSETLFQSKYNSVRSAKVVADTNTGLSKGYGFVRFSDEKEQQNAMVEMKGKICGSRPIRVSVATPKNRLGMVPLSPTSPIQGKQYPAPYPYGYTPHWNDPNNTTVFVGGLAPNVTEEELYSHFSPFGEILNVKIPPGMRCGFVSFQYHSSAEMSIQQLAGVNIGGSNVRLSWGNSPAPYPNYYMLPPYPMIPVPYDPNYIQEEPKSDNNPEQTWPEDAVATAAEDEYPPSSSDHESRYKTL
ncbi:hypothetical protein HDV01_005220 [Terramyces sp. JEL0728]|nr:hypothetical protein HDV01_005220 [Terramyces sp. JEL0728]